MIPHNECVTVSQLKIVKFKIPFVAVLECDKLVRRNVTVMLFPYHTMKLLVSILGLNRDKALGL